MVGSNIDITTLYHTFKPHISVDFSITCSLICSDRVTSLWGIGCLQFYPYCEKFWKTDQRRLKVYMSSLWVLETVHQALLTNNAYVYFVKAIADPTLLVRYQKISPVIAVLTAFIDAILQVVFVRRAWYLSDKSRLLTGVLSVAVSAQFALTMAYSIISKNLPQDNDIPLQLTAAVAVGLTDTFLAVTLVWLLRKARSGFRRSDSIVNHLVAYIVGSSLVTVACWLVGLIGSRVAPHSFIYLLSGLLLPKLYFNCLLASLNTRSSLRVAAGQESGGVSIHLENLSSSSSGESNRPTRNSNKNSIPNAMECRINIDVETVETSHLSKFSLFLAIARGEAISMPAFNVDNTVRSTDLLIVMRRIDTSILVRMYIHYILHQRKPPLSHSSTRSDQNISLWGVGCLQFYIYCEKFWKIEKRWLKLCMSLLWILDTVHQAFIANSTYVAFVKGIVDPILLLRLQKGIPTTGALTAVIDAAVQALLIRRAWYLSSKNRARTGALSVIVLAQFAVSLAYSIRIASIEENVPLAGAVPLQIASAAVATITDTCLAVTIVWLLRRARSGVRRTDSIVNRLVTYTIGSSLVTAICALFSLISAVIAPHSLIYIIGDFLLPKLYFNCLLASLNARSSLRAAANQESCSMSIHFENSSSSSAEVPNCSTSKLSKASMPEAIECRVNIDVETALTEWIDGFYGQRTRVRSGYYLWMFLPCGDVIGFQSYFLSQTSNHNSIRLTSVLWGVGCLQFYLYCEKYWKTERRWLKLHMSLLWILDTVHQALLMNILYILFVKGIADPTLLYRFQETSPAVVVLTSLISALAQVIFVQRAWYLSDKNYVILGTLSIAVLAQFAENMAYFARIVNIRDIRLIGDNLLPIEFSTASVTVFTDTFLAVVLIWLLRKARSGFRRTDSIVNRLVAYIVGSSLITVVCSLVGLIGATVAPHSFIYMSCGLVLTKLYFNCLLALLNARSSLQSNEDSTTMSFHLENFSSSTTAELNHSVNDPIKASIPKTIGSRVSVGTNKPTAQE
ncbi:hypothetical protein A7U60_g1123 [Sanghuangporus baumii]|uniref:DUF6534 domain-containing protein n=1 Tax=Sanghuangporus baumii TaxID=108892 RepID=A0A9Q5NEY3_SANBA|nr:hypothetical protein A7U60_g1123 [Sanghuangporus baumii]